MTSHDTDCRPTCAARRNPNAECVPTIGPRVVTVTSVRHASHLALMGEVQMQAWGRDRSLDLPELLEAFLDAVEAE